MLPNRRIQFLKIDDALLGFKLGQRVHCDTLTNHAPRPDATDRSSLEFGPLMASATPGGVRPRAHTRLSVDSRTGAGVAPRQRARVRPRPRYRGLRCAGRPVAGRVGAAERVSDLKNGS